MTLTDNPLERELYGKSDLTRLINPASIAVIGASSTAGSFGLRAMQNIDVGYAGQVYPINPRHKTILNHICYASIADVPNVPDCALLAIPRDHVERTLQECASLGVGGAIVFSSGFAELGTEEGRRAQQSMATIARDSGMRVCGPNCMGIFNIASRVGLSFQPGFHTMSMVDGGLGLVVQSGALGYVLLQAMQRGVGFTNCLSPGNSCDVDVCDFINYLIEDDATRAIACSFEGVQSGGRLKEVCRRALAVGKPLIAYKIGSSYISKRTAMSHTGTLAGDAAAYQAVFDRYGVTTVDNFEGIVETALFFSKAGPPSSGGVGVLAASGGSAVITADKAELHGVILPAPAPATAATLAEIIPAFGSSQNPADITAEALKDIEMYGRCVTAFAQDPSFAAVVVPMMSAYKPPTVDRAKYLCELAHGFTKPVCLVWMSEWYEGPGSEVYDGDTRICTFRSMDRCIRTLSSWMQHYKRRSLRQMSDAARLSDVNSSALARAVLRDCPPCGALSERDSKNVLATYGIEVTREAFAATPEEAVVAALKIGYPVAMKAESADIPHKTEAGVIRLHLKSETDVRSAYASIMEAVSRLPNSPAVEGVVVQEMVESGVEVMLGVRQDPQFGTLVVCGLGGVFVELLKDVAVALAPIDMVAAKEKIRSLKGYPILEGFRGSPSVNVETLATMMCRLSELGCDLADEISEIDINPVILDATGGTAVDALIVRRG